MGIRGELFSTRFACDGRTYFFNVKQNRNGDVFLSIVESKPSEGESFDRRSIVIFGEHMEEFLKSFQSALKFIDKTGIKVAPDPNAYTRGDDEGERPRRIEESRPRRSDDSRPPRREHDSPREGRTSSYREHEASDQSPRRRAVVRTGPSNHADAPKSHSGAPSSRSYSSSRPSSPMGRSPDRAGKAPSSAPRGTDKPIKRIVVRKVKKSGPAD